MSAVRRLRNFWILWVTTIVLACFSNAVAQASYKVTDLGAEGNDNLGCAMSLNNQGWTEIMAGVLDPSGKLLSGRAVIDVDGLKTDLGTLGGPNSWMMWGEINDRGEVVGFSETSVPDPNGEDVCGFGTHLTCRPFVWQNGHMSALPTLGGNNGQASAINNHGQIAGFAENGIVDSTCPPGTTNNRIQLPVLWENGKAQALPTVGSDPDGIAFGINNQGQAVGYSGTCTVPNVVLWETALPSRFLTSELRAVSPSSLTTRAKLLGKSPVLTAQPPMPLFGRTAQSQTSALCREILAPTPPVSTTRAKWWEPPSTPTSTSTTASSGRTA